MSHNSMRFADGRAEPLRLKLLSEKCRCMKSIRQETLQPTIHLPVQVSEPHLKATIHASTATRFAKEV